MMLIRMIPTGLHHSFPWRDSTAPPFAADALLTDGWIRTARACDAHRMNQSFARRLLQTARACDADRLISCRLLHTDDRLLQTVRRMRANRMNHTALNHTLPAYDIKRRDRMNHTL